MVSSFLAVCSGVKAGNHVQVQNKQPHKVVPALGHGSQEITAIKKLECVCVRGNDGTCHQCNTNVFRIVFFFVTKMGLCGTEDEDSRLRYPHCRFGSAH